MVANKNLNKRKSLNSQTPNKPPVKKLKVTEITPKQLQSPRLKSGVWEVSAQKISPAKSFQKLARSPKLTAISKPAQAKQQKIQPKIDSDNDEESEDVDLSDLEMTDDDSVESEEDGSVDGDDASIEGGEDDSIDEEEIDAIEGEGDESVEAEDDDSVEGEDKINVDTDTDENEEEDVEKKSPAPATVKSSKNQKGGTPEFVVFVGQLDFKKTEKDVRDFFTQAGEILRVDLLRFRSNLSRGCGYVAFKTEAGYKNALALNHTNFGGRRINVNPATEKPSNKRRPQKKSPTTPVNPTNGK